MCGFYRGWRALSVYNAHSRFPYTLPMTEPVRLAKRLAALIPCSRREAELYIAGGWVTVDGKVVEEPQFMVSEQEIELLPGATLVPIEPITILFHQPPATEMNADSILRLIRAETKTAE